MAQSMANADAALKQDFLPGLRQIFSEKAFLDSYAQKNTEMVEGQYARLALYSQANGGIGSRAASGSSLPSAGQLGFAEERVSMRYHYGRFEVEEPVIQASKTDKGAVMRALAANMKSLGPSMKRDLNRQRFGTSDGVIATAGVTTASTTVVLAAATTAVQTRQLGVGMIVDIGTVATPTSVASARTITAVNRTAKTITISGAVVTTAATDFIFRSGNGGSGANQKELTGLQTIVDSTGTLFNVDPTLQPDWAATESSNAGVNRAPTENLFRSVLDDVSIYSGGEADFGVCSHGVHRSFASQLTAAKQFVNTVDMKGGYQGLEILGPNGPIGMNADRDCPSNMAFFLSSQNFIDAIMAEYGWMERDGAILRAVSGFPSYEAVLFTYREQMTDHRAAHAKIVDLSEA